MTGPLRCHFCVGNIERGHILETCLEAGLLVDHVDEDILGSGAQGKGETGHLHGSLGRVSSWQAAMRP